jgi:hypothetical protein
MKRSELHPKVIKQISQDIDDGDTSALFYLLRFIPIEDLQAFLPETGE